MTDQRITACEFKSLFTGVIVAGMDLGAGSPEVHVTYADGTVELLFSFYVDELRFSPAEFIGLTRGEALDLWRRRDLAWLRS
jgi:hypothetical protein